MSVRTASVAFLLVAAVAMVTPRARAHETPLRRELVALVEAERLSVMIRLVVPEGNESDRLDRLLSPGPGGRLDASRRALASRLLQPLAQSGLGVLLDGQAVPLVLLRADVTRRDSSLGGWEFRGTYRAELALAGGAVHGLVIATGSSAAATVVDVLIDPSLDATSEGHPLERLGPILMLPAARREIELRAAHRAAAGR